VETSGASDARWPVRRLTARRSPPRRQRAAYGGRVIALVALVFNPFFLMTVAAIANGIYVL
jgi:hypothetical protein